MDRRKKTYLTIVLFLVFSLTAGTIMSRAGDAEPEKSGIEIEILYDNYIYTKGTKADWGFSCLITGTEKTILFDTGTDSKILWYNIKELDVDMDTVDIIVISHNHGDHTGGLFSVLERIEAVPVYIPSSFPDSFVRLIDEKGSKAIKVSGPMEICENVFSTGEMGTSIIEQSLVIRTEKGSVLITGCAHPGIVDIIEKADEVVDEKVTFALGGFHLMSKTENQVGEIIHRFRELGVTMCGATHCTGDEAIRLFKEAYGENYIPIGVGRIITIK